MIKQLVWAGVLAVGAAAAGGAQAQTAEPRTGPYVAVDVGLAAVNDTDLDYSEDGDTLAGEVQLKNAFDIGGAIGYDFGSVRTDIEVDYSRNRIEGLRVKGLNGTAVTPTAVDVAEFCEDEEEEVGCGGHVRQLSALANIWFDIPTGSVVSPYVGGGVGVGGFQIDDEAKARFAWQLGAGVAVQVTPGVSLTADYRFRSMGSTTFTDEEYPDYSLRVGKIQTSTFSAGLRFTF